MCYTRGCEKSRRNIMEKNLLNLKFTQVEIAEMMGVKQPQVSNWLNGKRIPTANNLVKLANILELYPEELLLELQTIQGQNNLPVTKIQENI